MRPEKKERSSTFSLRLRMALAAVIVLPSPVSVPIASSRIVWAWERPESLATLPTTIGVAAMTGYIRLRGSEMVVNRGRRFPIITRPDHPAPIAVIHIEIDQNEPLAWSPELASRVTASALSFAGDAPEVQIDMEVRASQRDALLDVLRGVRAGLPRAARLSMTALASWCENETWLDQAPVDEIVPMLFRMGRGGLRLRAKLAAGGDFARIDCRKAIGIATDTPSVIPPGRRVYIFNPRTWDATAIAALGSE